jgi:HrpA-like RNA helicase
LKSKSKGKGDDRFITVTKNNAIKDRKTFFELQLPTRSLLSHIFQAYPLLSSSSPPLAAPSHRTKFTSQVRSGLASSSSLQFYEMKQLTRTRHSDYNLFQKNRSKLPASAHQEVVLQLLKSHNIILISGETGSVCSCSALLCLLSSHLSSSLISRCGKTTQVPQFIFDDPEIGPSCRIAVTQPRRLSAMSVSERIATERGEQVGLSILLLFFLS